MKRRLFSLLGLATLSLTILLMVAEPGAARGPGGGGGGRGYGGGGRGYGGYGGHGYYGGYGRGWGGYGWGGYYGVGGGYPYYSSGFYGDYPSYPSGTYYYPSYATYEVQPSAVYTAPVPSSSTTSLYPPEAATPADAALIEVQVPQANAEIWFSGHKTEQQGMSRTFETPSLNSTSKAAYEIRARWTENGQTVDQTRKIQVHPGDRLNVNFTQPAAQDQRQPRSEEVAPPLPAPANQKP